jgi:drug/metabolite transporter (DMT)-like permease
VAPPSGPAERAPQLMRFVRAVCLGTAVFVAGAVFVSSGSTHLFAVGAVCAGVGWAVLTVIGRWISRVRVRPRELARAAFIGAVYSALLDGVRRWR